MTQQPPDVPTQDPDATKPEDHWPATEPTPVPEETDDDLDAPER